MIWSLAEKNCKIRNSIDWLLSMFRENWAILFLFFIYFFIFSIFLILRYNSFESGYYDFGLQLYSLNAAFKNPSSFFSLIIPTSNSLIGHLNPIFLFILPIFTIIPDPIFLLVLTSFAIGASIFPLYLLAKNHLNNKKNALLICIIYLINPLLHNSNRYDFHLITFVPFFIFSSIYFYEKKKVFSFIFFSLLANSTHEFVCLLTSCLALSLILKELKLNKINSPFNMTRKIKAPIFVLFIGIIWFSVSIIIQNYFDPSTSLTNWVSLGSTQNFDVVQKIVYLLQMFLPLLFIPVLEPIFLFPILPYVAVILISTHPGYWSINYQYGAFTIAFLCYSIILALKNLPNINFIRKSKLTIKKLLLLLIVSNLAFAVTYSALSPISNISWSRVTDHDRLLKSLLDNIPKNSSVLTQSQMYPHVADRHEVALYMSEKSMPGRVFNFYPDFIFFDITKASFYTAPKIFGLTENQTIPLSKYVNKLITEGNYNLFSACDGAYIYQNKINSFIQPKNVRVVSLTLDKYWKTTGTIQEIHNGISIKGGKENYSLAYDLNVELENKSYSLSCGLKTFKSYGSDSWAGIIFGYQDENNYLCLYLRYPGGHVQLIEVSNGKYTDTVVGAIPYPSEEYQYFFMDIHENQMWLYINSIFINKIDLNATANQGFVGIANWQQDTDFQSLLLTEK